MKKQYEAPTMKVFVINADERITAECGGGSHFIQVPDGCSDLLVGGLGNGSCTEGVVSGS